MELLGFEDNIQARPLLQPYGDIQKTTFKGMNTERERVRKELPGVTPSLLAFRGLIAKAFQT